MHKILLIIQREYLSRVKKKSFIVLTILVPVLFIGMFALIGYIAAKGDDFGDKKKIEVVDESGSFINNLKNTGSIEYVYTQQNFDTAKAKFLKDGYTYLLHIPATLSGIELWGEKNPSPMNVETIEGNVTDVAQSFRLKAAGIDTAVLAKAQQHITINPHNIDQQGQEKDAQVYASYGIGLLSAFLIYMSLFLYGTQVMRGVIEEKVSRVIEVIISSVRPFQLMMGKIIGIGMVGLTQFLLWIIISVVLSMGAGTLLVQHAIDAKTSQVTQIHQATTARTTEKHAQPADNKMGQVMQSLNKLPKVKIISCFLFYFLLGYLLYSALFATVGSAVDNETETQQFMLPITLPLIFTFALSQIFIMSNPDSPIMVWLSMIPFTSPVAMMIRIPFGGVTNLQLITSMGLMVVAFVFTTWGAGRIYRVGILMYGKKATYRELAKWFMYKE